VPNVVVSIWLNYAKKRFFVLQLDSTLKCDYNVIELKCAILCR